MADTPELIAEIRDELESSRMTLTMRGTLLHRASTTIAAQAQELTQERARNHAFMAAAEQFENRAEAAEARVRGLEQRCNDRDARIGILEKQRDAIEAKTIERCAKEAERWEPMGYDIAAAIRALRHIGREG